MNNSYLKSQLLKLQNEYCDILKISKGKLTTEDFPFVIDEINLFWFSNRSLIELILNNLYNDYNCFVHTGASFLDVDNLEHFPFATIGTNHLIDDPVANFSDTMPHVLNDDFRKRLKGQIILTTEQNIKIIENYSEIIQILPIRFLNSSDRTMSQTGAEKAFLGLFKDEKLTMNDYFKKYNNIEDVSNGLREHIEDLISLSEYEEEGSLIIRFKKFVSENALSLPKDTNGAVLFSSLIIGYFMQAFDILFVSLKYPLNPYLRYPIPFHYIHLLASSMPAHLDDLLLKIKIAYTIHKIFDTDKVKDVNFECYYKLLQNNNFSSNLIKVLKQHFDNPNQAPIKEFNKLIEDELCKLYEIAGKEILK